MRGHGGQGGERGSYRNAWAEGNYTRQGLDGESGDEDAPTADVRSSYLLPMQIVAALLITLGLSEHSLQAA